MASAASFGGELGGYAMIARFLRPSCALLIACAFLQMAPSLLGEAKEAARSVGDKRFAVTAQGGTGTLLLMADRPLDQAAPDVKRLLITIHGTGRNVGGYYKAAAHIVRTAGTIAQGTMVVAPNFVTHDEIEDYKLPSDILYWSDNGWKRAEGALGPSPISSYAALEALIEHFADRTLYPSLHEIVLTGHSAGGQFVQRFASTNHIEDGLARSGVNIRYVVANPSSYLYFSDDRPGSDGRFGRVDGGACRKFSHWHYGFRGAPSYVDNRSPADYAGRYVRKNVTYLLGLEDKDPNAPELDTSCGAEMEGPSRLMRGLFYFEYLKTHFGAVLRHRVVEVPGAGHDERIMYTSPCSVAVLFGWPVPRTCPQMSSRP